MLKNNLRQANSAQEARDYAYCWMEGQGLSRDNYYARVMRKEEGFRMVLVIPKHSNSAQDTLVRLVVPAITATCDKRQRVAHTLHMSTRDAVVLSMVGG